jgi:hypothetical protein
MTRQEAVSLMRRSNTRAEWSRNMSQIKEFCGGDWPNGFWSDLLASGAFGEFQTRMEAMDRATVRAVYP